MQKKLTVRVLESLLKERGDHKVSRTYISLLETGKRKPTYEVAYALSEVLGIDVQTALASAFQARRDFDLAREKRDLQDLAKRKKLKGVDIDLIISM
jgi:transcriptional regulator with XRE-family HTH domain